MSRVCPPTPGCTPGRAMPGWPGRAAGVEGLAAGAEGRDGAGRDIPPPPARPPPPPRPPPPRRWAIKSSVTRNPASTRHKTQKLNLFISTPRNWSDALLEPKRPIFDPGQLFAPAGGNAGLTEEPRLTAIKLAPYRIAPVFARTVAHSNGTIVYYSANSISPGRQVLSYQASVGLYKRSRQNQPFSGTV